MTCSIPWMAWCELWLRDRLNGRNTGSSPWSYHDRRCLNITLKWLKRRVSSSFLHIFSILSGCCNSLQSVMRAWISILRTRHSLLPDNNRPFWSTWRMNTVANIDVCQSIHMKAHRAAISSLPQRLQDLDNLPMIHLICPAMMKNT